MIVRFLRETTHVAFQISWGYTHQRLSFLITLAYLPGTYFARSHVVEAVMMYVHDSPSLVIVHPERRDRLTLKINDPYPKTM